MSTSYPDLFAALAAPFPRHLVKQRPQGGRQLDYITARTVMNRCDDVLGPENWWDTYVQGEHSVICKLTIRLPDGSTLTKEDAGGYAGMSDQGDDDKSGFSDAFKRAAVKFGIGRELYKDGVAGFVSGEHGHGQPPAQHNGHHAPPPRPRPQPQQDAPRGGNDNAPRSGRALFAWTRKQEEEHGVALLNWLNGFIKETIGDRRMVDLSEPQVAAVYAEARRRLAEAGSGPEDQTQEAAPDGDVPFDRAAAWTHLLDVAEDLAMDIFQPYDGTDAQLLSALQTLDVDVPVPLRVKDWGQCQDRDSFKAYYRAALMAKANLQTEPTPR